MDSLKIYMPTYYLNNIEMNKLLETSDFSFSSLDKNMIHTQDNCFVIKMDTDSVMVMEKMLNIKHLSSETIEFRRDRIINRLNNKPPFNLAFLKNKLNTIYGSNKYLLVIDYQNLTITLESSTDNQAWFKEGHITILSIKPANLKYIHIPLFKSNISSKEFATVSQMYYAKAGSAVVGITPLARRGEEKEVVLL